MITLSLRKSIFLVKAFYKCQMYMHIIKTHSYPKAKPQVSESESDKNILRITLSLRKSHIFLVKAFLSAK